MLWNYRPSPIQGRQLRDLPPAPIWSAPEGRGLRDLPYPPSMSMEALYRLVQAGYGIPPEMRTFAAISRHGTQSTPVDKARPAHSVQEERAIDATDPNMGSCSGPYEVVRRLTRTQFITHGDPITDATPIP